MAFFIAVSSLYVIPPDVAEAADITMRNGEFYYATTVKKATSSVRYRTIGWQLHSKPGCPRQPPSVKRLGPDVAGVCQPGSVFALRILNLT
jgi:hypothetical protein